MTPLFVEQIMRGLFAVLLVGISMAIFETFLYYVVVKPTFVTNLSKSLSKISLDSDYDDVIDELGTDVIIGLSRTDEQVGNYTNNLKLLSMSLIILILILAAAFVWMKMRENIQIAGNPKLMATTQYKNSIQDKIMTMNILFVLLPLLGFQGFLFLFAKKYNYATPHEIKLRAVNSLLDNMGREDEKIDLPSGVSLV